MEVAQQYIESEQYTVYMDGVIFFFDGVLDEEMKEELRDIIGTFDWDSEECSEIECRVYEWLNQYMGGDRTEEVSDFGFEGDTLYLNFHDACFSFPKSASRFCIQSNA